MINLKHKKPSIFTLDNEEIISGYIIGRRLPDDEVPEYYHKYEIRGSDDDPGKYTTLEKSVVVNFCDTFITKTKINLDFSGKKYREIKDYNLGTVIL